MFVSASQGGPVYLQLRAGDIKWVFECVCLL